MARNAGHRESRHRPARARVAEGVGQALLRPVQAFTENQHVGGHVERLGVAALREQAAAAERALGELGKPLGGLPGHQRLRGDERE